MSKAPDLSSFPIPRKGGARPIVHEEIEERGSGAGERAGPTATPRAQQGAPPSSESVRASGAEKAGAGPRPKRLPDFPSAPAPIYGQTVATTVKLDENRYLRLMEAGKPGPGRLRRRTIQDMLIEALDEWFERRQL
jgi:hypothetical protein